MFRSLVLLLLSAFLFVFVVSHAIATRIRDVNQPAANEFAVAGNLDELGAPGFAETLMFMRSPTTTLQLQQDRMQALSELQKDALAAQREKMSMTERLETFRIGASVEKAGMLKSGIVALGALAVVAVAFLVLLRVGLAYATRPHAPVAPNVNVYLTGSPPPSLLNYARQLADHGFDARVEYIHDSPEYTGWVVVNYDTQELIPENSSVIRALLTG